MKLRIALAVAALVTAGTGVALAQSSGQIGYPPEPDSFQARGPHAMVRQGVIDASRDIHLACALDMHRYCAGKDGAAADRCLVYHRVNFSKPCRNAIRGFERAVEPIGADESVAKFGPYSRYQARSEPPASGWLIDPAPRTATGS